MAVTTGRQQVDRYARTQVKVSLASTPRAVPYSEILHAIGHCCACSPRKGDRKKLRDFSRFDYNYYLLTGRSALRSRLLRCMSPQLGTSPPNARTLLHRELAKADMRSEQQLENIGPAASNAGDGMLIPACRRIIAADRIGWQKHGDTLERASDPTSGASSALRK